MAFVLKHRLDRNDLLRIHILCATHNSKRPVSDNFQVSELQLVWLVIGITGGHCDRLAPHLLHYDIMADHTELAYRV